MKLCLFLYTLHIKLNVFFCSICASQVPKSNHPFSAIERMHVSHTLCSWLKIRWSDSQRDGATWKNSGIYFENFPHPFQLLNLFQKLRPLSFIPFVKPVSHIQIMFGKKWICVDTYARVCSLVCCRKENFFPNQEVLVELLPFQWRALLYVIWCVRKICEGEK